MSAIIRLSSVTVPPDTSAADLPRVAASLLGVAPEAIRACRAVRRAVDARHRDDVRLVFTLELEIIGDEAAILRRCKYPHAAAAKPSAPYVIPRLQSRPAHRPVVVGTGPAGLFAALVLARGGAEPIVLERGLDVDARRARVETFWRTGALDEECNVQFGEGGAGTFSDGKLNTGIKDPRCGEVLRTFARHGAPEEILWQAKPHIGTDKLGAVVRGMRVEIESLGGTVRFGARVDGLAIEGGALRGVRIGGETLRTDCAVLAVGHSARDTFALLDGAGIALASKPFSIGVRVEHPQKWLDGAQYGRFAGHPALGAADYKLSARLADGRGAYTFCMCPGGVVVAAASEAGGVVTNGMSAFLRDGENANSALLVDVRPEDFGAGGPLSGIAFQREWERRAYDVGGGGYRAPAQRVSDFLAGRASRALGDVQPSYLPGVTPGDLRACLPAFVAEALREAIVRFDRQIRGFAAPDAVLTGVETRSSSPVRVLRDDSGQASAQGLFPAGEGAGYAGGILSAAVDGMRAGERALAMLDRE